MAIIRSDEILDKVLDSDTAVVPRYDIVDSEGQVVVHNAELVLKNPILAEGTAINKQVLDECLAASGETTGTAEHYELHQPNFGLSDGALIRFKLHVDSGATPTIDVNGTGAKALMLTKFKPMRAGMHAGTWVTAVYSSTFDFFLLQGSGNLEVLRFGNGVGQTSTWEFHLCGHNDPGYVRPV